jgi:hypothetical protein
VSEQEKEGSIMKKVTQIARKATEKKPYVRPELSRHGKVESLTQDYKKGGYSSPVILKRD